MKKQRGRKKSVQASENVVELELIAGRGQKRPEPPDFLNDFEAAVWQKTVGAKSDDWFSPETHELLIAYCRHCCQAANLDKQIAKFTATALKRKDSLAKYERFLKMRDMQTKSIMALATKMRLTHMSKYLAKTAARKAQAVPDAPKPWET